MQNPYIHQIAVSWFPALTSTQVMLLEVDFAGENTEEDANNDVKRSATQRGMTKAKLKVLKDIEAAGAFLEKHETAKIIVSIDAHCIEDSGLLVWLGDNVDNLSGPLWPKLNHNSKRATLYGLSVPALGN